MSGRGLLLFLLCIAAPLLAQQPPVTERGFKPEKVYDFGEFDNVNTFNGNVMINIPIGDRYKVNGNVGYGFTLSYNSKVWDFERSNSPQPSDTRRYRRARGNRNSNAGLGWVVTLGRLVPPDSEENETPQPVRNWVYQSPDGGDHAFAAQMRVGDPIDNNVAYTYDETYLRRRLIFEGAKLEEVEVEFPDGNFHVFDADGRLKELRDRFGNVATLDAFDRATNAPFVDNLEELGICRANTVGVWRLSDTHREQYVCFKDYTYDSGAKRMVDRISLAAFNGTRANYDFEYAQLDVQKPCDHEYWLGETNPGFISFPILQTVTLRPSPAEAALFQWTFQTYSADGQARECRQGSIQSVTLPTLGKVEYRYREWEVPIQNMCLGSAASTRYTGGIGERIVYDAHGTQLGSWKYTSHLAPIQLSSINCAPVGEPASYPPVYEWFRTTVETPIGDKTESYFSVWHDPGGSRSDANDPLGFRNEEYNRPFSRRGIDGELAPAAGPFLSTSVLDCAPGGLGCSRLRSTSVRYMFDPGPSGVYEPTRGARVDLSRTVYHDDADRFRQTAYSDFDGFGHFRTAVATSNFGAGDHRETFTNWNPESNSLGRRSNGTPYIPPSNPVWLLNTYAQTRTTQNNVMATTDFCFSSTNGFLSGRRVWTGNTAAATDVVTIYSQVAGNVVEENWYGGDRTPLTSGDICTPRAGSEYQIVHGWSAGSLASSEYRDASFLSLDLTIDAHTGRARFSRDTAGQQTEYAYDRLGRLTSIAEPGVAAASYAHTRATPRNGSTLATPAKVEIVKGTTQSVFQFDWFGRVWREKVKMADGTMSVRETLYNPLGWKTSVSEMERLVIPSGGTEFSFSPVAKTTFNAHDPFGRPGSVTGPDNESTLFTYAGDRLLTRRVDIATSAFASSEVATKEMRDGQQRLWRVIENADATDGEVTTTYGYDVGDRLTSVDMAGQLRFFTYDRRGFLTSEQHPEIGANGHGTVSYLGYDSRGHAHRRVTGGVFDLTFDFDEAERLTLVTETSSGDVVKEFSYDDPDGETFAQCSGNRCNGKLAAAARWNRFADLGDIAVTESYTYDGPGGRMSRRDQSVGSTSEFDGESFRVSQTYDSLGNVGSITYPCRTNQPCSPQRTVNYGYTNGALTSITNYATITYQANGLPRTVAHSNSINDTILRDRSGMARPCSLASYGPGALLLTSTTDPCGETVSGSGNRWTSGEYEYDGAGNIRRIGDTRYSYDAFSRLTSWTTGNATNYTTISRTYDTFGNFLTSGTAICLSTTTTARCSQSSSTSLSVVGMTNRYEGATYDAAGSVTSTGAWSFVYDTIGTMQSSSTAAGRQFRYLYTPDDERIAVVERINGANKTLWTIRGLSQQLLRIYSDDSTSGTRTWTWREDPIWRASLLLASETSSGVRHYSVDHLGTPRWITGAGGTAIGTQTLDPFGLGGTADSTLQFTGHERDTALIGDTSGLSLDYMHARYYWAGWGRFLSVDPVTDKRSMRAPQLWNRFGYAGLNPLKYIDPTGRVLELVGTEEEQARALGDLRRTVAAEHRIFIQVRKVNGKTIVDSRTLNLGPKDSSGNFHTLRVLANSPGHVEVNTSATSFVLDSGNRYDLGPSSGRAGFTLTPTNRGDGKRGWSVLVDVGANDRLRPRILAHELVHAMGSVLGIKGEHELLSSSPGDFSFRMDPYGIFNVLASEAAREASSYAP